MDTNSDQYDILHSYQFMFRIDGNGYEGGERTNSASRSSSDRQLTGEMIRQMNAKKDLSCFLPTNLQHTNKEYTRAKSLRLMNKTWKTVPSNKDVNSLVREPKQICFI